MKQIFMNEHCNSRLTIMIFVEGTILKPKSWLLLYKHKSYIPIGNAAKMIAGWQEQGANIIYCTSRKKKHAYDIADLLKNYGFLGSFLAVREGKEKYKDIVEALMPDVLIEDDCKSIGGAWQMCISKVNPKIKESIASIVVPISRN